MATRMSLSQACASGAVRVGPVYTELAYIHRGVVHLRPPLGKGQRVVHALRVPSGEAILLHEPLTRERALLLQVLRDGFRRGGIWNVS
jgi:hypothetical protein